MGSKAPTDSPPADDGDSNAPPPPDSDSASPPPPPPPSDSSPPPPHKKSPPPPQDSSPPPSPPPPSSPPPSPKKSPPPPQESSPPPPSPPPENLSPPPSSPPPSPTKKKDPPDTTTPSPPEEKPVPTTPVTPSTPDGGTKSPATPVDGADTKSPPASAGVVVGSPPGKAFAAPAPAVTSGPAKTPSAAVSGSSGGSKSSNTGAIAGGVVGGVVFVVAVVLLWIFCRRRKKQEKYNKVRNSPSPSLYQKQHAINIPPGGLAPSPPPPYLPPRPQPGSGGGSPYLPSNRTPGGGSSFPPFSPEMMNQNHLAYEDLVAATDGFANANVLGQGGFGFVHKGVLPGGKEVAVKCLKSGSGQGEREFQAEVDIISRVHHRHLVSLVGYCIAGEKRMLVYEFVPNNTLEYHLHKSTGPPLDFSTRVRIALGSAKGLAYLHEDCHPRIIHRDIKAANILLDHNFEAQVADFGLARLYTDTNTHVSTRVMGTFGYLAPEYASSGKLTDKSDVFSFGVVLLELITGRRAVDLDDQSMEDSSLVDWARPLLSKALTEGHYDELADPRLERNYNTQEMANMVACAAASVRHSAKRRPRMSQVARTLEGDMSGLDGTRTGQNTSREYDTTAYNADLKKFRQMAFVTETTGGSSIGTTSEYGLNPSSSTSAASSNDNSPRDSTNYSNL